MKYNAFCVNILNKFTYSTNKKHVSQSDYILGSNRASTVEHRDEGQED